MTSTADSRLERRQDCGRGRLEPSRGGTPPPTAPEPTRAAATSRGERRLPGAGGARSSRDGATGIAARSAIGVVIPARDAALTLGYVLDALLGIEMSLDVVVVDDHSADSTARLACRHELPATVLRLPRRCGPGMARNVGVAVTEAETICFLDADMVVSGAALAEHGLRVKRGDVVAQGLRLDLRLDPESRDLPTRARQLLLDAEVRARAEPPPPHRLLDAAFLSLPRAAFLGVGGFDPEFSRGWGYDAAYLGQKLRANGLAVEPLPRAVGLHLLTPYSEARRRSREALQRDNLLLYRRLLNAPAVGGGPARFHQHTNRLLRQSLRLS